MKANEREDFLEYLKGIGISKESIRMIKHHMNCSNAFFSQSPSKTIHAKKEEGLTKSDLEGLHKDYIESRKATTLQRVSDEEIKKAFKEYASKGDPPGIKHHAYSFDDFKAGTEWLSQSTESNSSNNSSSWILVEERLPKDDQECDLWHKSKGRCINYHFLDYQTTKGRLAYFRSNDGGIIQHNLKDITHWHPLPPPPDKKGKEGKGGNDLFIKGSSVAT